MRQEPSGTLPQIGAARAKYVKFHQRSHPVATFLPDVPTQVQLNVSVTLAGSLRIARKRSILRCGCSSPGVGSGLRRVNKDAGDHNNGMHDRTPQKDSEFEDVRVAADRVTAGSHSSANRRSDDRKATSTLQAPNRDPANPLGRGLVERAR